MFDDPDIQSDAEARLGMTLCGKYRLDSILGIGGMATVYAATHRNQAELAIKILHRDLGEEPLVRARFLREAYAANSVKHRNVVTIVDDDVAEDGSAFLVMERLRGASVEELRWHGGGKVRVHGAVAVLAELLDVLSAAHAQGIVHRDVKPANLFVTTEGEVKVLDFGIARTRERLASRLAVTGATAIMGTPAYMAPEQALPGMTGIDERTDVWGAGATLFALLSGRTVHEGDTAAAVVLNAALESGRSLVGVAPRAPRAIAEVVDCALAFDKARRWASAREMRAALLVAYRFHFGRAPSRASLVALLAPPVSGVASAGARSRSHVTVEAPHSAAASDAPPHGDGDTLFSRTSIPIAADAVPRTLPPPPRAWSRAAWVLCALAAAGPAAMIGQHFALREEGPRPSVAAQAPPVLEAGTPEVIVDP